ncbi:MAG: patatin family protein [Syntrophomonadaceae bacterium]|nr:patatin family protein [Syntrophomonadaceae bacterium]
MPGRKPKIALVLGAGSARGFAHIGVLQVLNKNGIYPNIIVGSSMGAMVGGVYACGADLIMLEKMLDSIDTRSFFDVQVPRMGFVAGKKISTLLKLLTKNKNFADLNIKLQIVATDLLSSQTIVLDQGSIAEAIRASISIPGIFHPVKRDGMVLVDGAITDRLPVDVAIKHKADLVIAVDVTFTEEKEIEIRNVLDVIIHSLDLMQKNHFEASAENADFLLQPRLRCFSSSDFSKSSQIIELGRQAAQEQIKAITAAVHELSL